MPKKYPPEVHDRAVRMAMDRLNDYPSHWAAAKALAPMLDVSPETMRKWILQARIDAGAQPGATSLELEENKRLKKENRDLKEANEILRAASIFFAGELDPRSTGSSRSSTR
ncbi:MAG: transposase [Acidimicrobiales bacterium]